MAAHAMPEPKDHAHAKALHTERLGHWETRLARLANGVMELEAIGQRHVRNTPGSERIIEFMKSAIAKREAIIGAFSEHNWKSPHRRILEADVQFELSIADQEERHEKDRRLAAISLKEEARRHISGKNAADAKQALSHLKTIVKSGNSGIEHLEAELALLEKPKDFHDYFAEGTRPEHIENLKSSYHPEDLAAVMRMIDEEGGRLALRGGKVVLLQGGEETELQIGDRDFALVFKRVIKRPMPAKRAVLPEDSKAPRMDPDSKFFQELERQLSAEKTDWDSIIEAVGGAGVDVDGAEEEYAALLAKMKEKRDKE